MPLNKIYWGETIWKTLYIIAYTFSPESPKVVDSVINFYTSLAHLLPCPECQIHYRKWLDENPIDESTCSSTDLLDWLYKLEKQVNPSASFGKRMRELTKNDPDIVKQSSPQNSQSSSQSQPSFRSQKKRKNKNKCNNCSGNKIW